jgi:hypothetical protein
MNALAAIHVARKQLGLDDETYRAVLVRVTGKASSKDMSERERGQVLDELRRQGFKPSKKALEGRFAKKLQALWIAAWNLGIVRNRADAALISFVQRQTGIEHVRFLHHPEDADKAIEALKAWMTREAGVDWTLGQHMAGWERMPGAKIAMAQWQLLAKAGEALPPFHAFKSYCEDHSFNPLDRMTAGEWAGIMNRLGERIRALRKVQ